MRSLDALIWETVQQQELFSTADTLLVCDDPDGTLIAAAVAHARTTGQQVVLLDANYNRCSAAASLGVDSAGTQRLDVFVHKLAQTTHAAIAFGRMPKSLARLDYLARSIAGASYRQASAIFGGNNKHLSRSMNTTLAEAFQDVHASRGRGKFRCIIAATARNVTYEPATANGFIAFGGVFAGTKIDQGGALLRQHLPQHPDQLGAFLDLGCGNGAVSRGLEGNITATDADADAVLSARAIGINATWDDAGSNLPSAHFDTIALNPPFHAGTTIDSTLVQHLLDAAHRLLSAEGALYLVHNSHLRYRPEVEKRFTHVEQIARNARFTVLRARR